MLGNINSNITPPAQFIETPPAVLEGIIKGFIALPMGREMTIAELESIVSYENRRAFCRDLLRLVTMKDAEETRPSIN